MPIVSQRFSEQNNPDLFYYSGAVYGKRHVAVITDRLEFNMPEAIALAMELPPSCWIAGGFAAAYINGLRPSRLDIFFGGESSFLETLKRFQNAAEGSYMHGYEQTRSVSDMNNNGDSILELVHPSKPTIYLVRTRWFGAAYYVTDSIDLVCEQVALGSDLFLTYGQSALQDAKDKVLKLYRMIWKTNTAMEIPRYEEMGFRVVGNDRYRDDYAKQLKGFLAGYVSAHGRNPPPYTFA